MKEKDFWQKRNEDMMSNIMKKRGFIEETNEHGVKVFRRPAKLIVIELIGRPARDTVIGDNDITNLNIALNISRSLEEFFEAV